MDLQYRTAFNQEGHLHGYPGEWSSWKDVPSNLRIFEEDHEWIELREKIFVPGWYMNVSPTSGQAFKQAIWCDAHPVPGWRRVEVKFIDDDDE